ncbi:MAG: SIMPL domain-containing protein [Methylacidiphilales bacterium]|nr:SIMPL domain-containing protein [Candidatus Methylacidiphilales bacterium]
MKRFLLVLTLLSLGLASPLAADQNASPPVRKVTVTGTAIIKVAPDQMYWSVQVSINDATLAKAKARHDASLTSTLAYIKSLGGAVRDLQTGGIRFDRQTYFPPDSDRSKPFSCSTQLTFTLTDFDKYGTICDNLAKFDGVEVQSIDYAYSKQADVRRDALKQALLNAHDKAGDLAATANCNLGAPLEIIEGSGEGPRPLMMNALARSIPGGTPAPVAGQIEIDGTVTATYELTPLQTPVAAPSK